MPAVLTHKTIMLLARERLAQIRDTLKAKIGKSVTLNQHVDPSLIGDWRGLYGQKNTAGAVCAMTALLFLFSRNGRDAIWGTAADKAFTGFGSSNLSDTLLRQRNYAHLDFPNDARYGSTASPPISGLRTVSTGLPCPCSRSAAGRTLAAGRSRSATCDGRRPMGRPAR
jgi:hypothetical protein